jgi:hypothetical protein
MSAPLVAPLRAPFPWFGGKSRASDIVWAALGDVMNYVEPFAGSLAVLLGRPHPAHIETVNDRDCYLANFWRAVQHDPSAVVAHADWPVNEADLHARHTWLVAQADFRSRMMTEPDFFDPRIAGWWVWGLSCWIGGGWCDVERSRASQARRPVVTGWSEGHGVHQGPGSVSRQIPLVGGSRVGCGVHQKRPVVAGGRTGNGTHRSGQTPRVDGYGGTGVAGPTTPDLGPWFEALQRRLRRTRVVCGDWSRVLTPTVLRTTGVTGVVLDPPYSHDVRDSDLYTHDDASLSASVRAWAREHGDDPALRIVLCGYEGEHEMPETWRCVAWKAGGGYGNQRNGGGNENARRERLWLSPHCLSGDGPLFESTKGTET